MSETIDLGYRSRSVFSPLHTRKQRWAAVVAHRRCGKTVACIADLIDAALRCTAKDPRFAYVAPYFSQAKDVAWNYLKHYTAPIPGVTANESELRVDLPGGRRIRLYGADNYERLRGLYFDGVVLDEYGDMDPRAWQEVVRASLADRMGWAVFIGTPKGMNHFADTFERARHSDDWLTMQLRASQTGLLPQSELDDARREMTDEQYAAEFECSFEASVVGSYFGKEMARAQAEGRICGVPWQEEVAVDTWWDIGMDDAMAVWCTQNVGREVHVIDYYEDSGAGLPGAARWLKDQPYIYGTHNVPHDAKVREWGSGKSRIEMAATLGMQFDLVPNIGKMDGIDAARSFIGRCWFDAGNTERGRNALVSYRKIWDEKRKVFGAAPLHDWSSNGADAFRYLAVGHKISVRQRLNPPQRRVMTQGAGSTAWMAS